MIWIVSGANDLNIDMALKHALNKYNRPVVELRSIR
jgi:hypothetical protein